MFSILENKRNIFHVKTTSNPDSSLSLSYTLYSESVIYTLFRVYSVILRWILYNFLSAYIYFKIIIGISCAASFRQVVGDCVEECSPFLSTSTGLSSCPQGYACLSNGCGHTCQKVDLLLQEPSI